MKRRAAFSRECASEWEVVAVFPGCDVDGEDSPDTPPWAAG